MLGLKGSASSGRHVTEEYKRGSGDVVRQEVRVGWEVPGPVRLEWLMEAADAHAERGFERPARV